MIHATLALKKQREKLIKLIKNYLFFFITGRIVLMKNFKEYSSWIIIEKGKNQQRQWSNYCWSSIKAITSEPALQLMNFGWCFCFDINSRKIKVREIKASLPQRNNTLKKIGLPQTSAREVFLNDETAELLVAFSIRFNKNFFSSESKSK